jgi:hypothetical protein
MDKDTIIGASKALFGANKLSRTACYGIAISQKAIEPAFDQ